MKKITIAILAALIAPTALFAGQEIKAPQPPEMFAKGVRELQVLTGATFGFSHEPQVDYADLTVRYGWMLTSPEGNGILRGNTELLVEGLAAGIFEGPGDAILGLSLQLRYNFVQPGAKLVPYFQIGVGGAWSDIHDEGGAAAKLVGGNFTFLLQSALGTRYFFNDRTAFTLEVVWNHLSTANLTGSNVGYNGIGGNIGVSWLF